LKKLLKKYKPIIVQKTATVYFSSLWNRANGKR
jgi:hypothetical protein